VGLFLDDTGRTLRSGWVIVLFALVAAVTYFIGSAAVGLLGLYPSAPLRLDDFTLFFTTLVMLGASGLATLVCALALKAQIGLPTNRALKNTFLGLGLGAALVTLAVAIPAVAGQGALTLYEGSLGALALAGLRQLLVLAPTSVGEELLLRGVVLRQLAIGTRPWIAVALTGCAFGVMHLLNPSASPIAALNVALVGLWFGVLAIRTSLWTSIGAHVAWNWFEGFVFGQPVSGIIPGPSLFAGSVQATGFFSGGDFGPEASGLTTVLLALATAASVSWPKKP
jgi:uncharacterized protein